MQKPRFKFSQVQANLVLDSFIKSVGTIERAADSTIRSSALFSALNAAGCCSGRGVMALMHFARENASCSDQYLKASFGEEYSEAKTLLLSTTAEYRKYFEGLLKKYEVSSVSELDDAEKAKFFEEVDKGWNSEDEEGKDGLTSDIDQELADEIGDDEFEDDGDEGESEDLIETYGLAVDEVALEIVRNMQELVDAGEEDPRAYIDCVSEQYYKTNPDIYWGAVYTLTHMTEMADMIKTIKDLCGLNMFVTFNKATDFAITSSTAMKASINQALTDSYYYVLKELTRTALDTDDYTDTVYVTFGTLGIPFDKEHLDAFVATAKTTQAAQAIYDELSPDYELDSVDDITSFLFNDLEGVLNEEEVQSLYTYFREDLDLDASLTAGMSYEELLKTKGSNIGFYEDFIADKSKPMAQRANIVKLAQKLTNKPEGKGSDKDIVEEYIKTNKLKASLTPSYNYHPETGDAINPSWKVDPRTGKEITSSAEERKTLQADAVKNYPLEAALDKAQSLKLLTKYVELISDGGKTSDPELVEAIRTLKLPMTTSTVTFLLNLASTPIGKKAISNMLDEDEASNLKYYMYDRKAGIFGETIIKKALNYITQYGDK